MYKYVLKRLLMMIPVLVGVLLIVFTINQMMPGDPAIMLAGGEQATPMEIERVREELGLNDPLPIQFFNYAKGLILEGDLGTSYATKRPVFEEVTERLPIEPICSIAFSWRWPSASPRGFSPPYASTAGLTTAPWASP